MKLITLTLLFISVFLVMSPAHAGLFSCDSAEVKVEPLGMGAQKVLADQKAQVDSLARMKLGRPVRGDFSDLKLLQRLVDGEYIAPENTKELQSLGVVFGDVFVKELNLEWKLYRDELGCSKATCISNTDVCLFPMTMISRRAEVGAPVDIKAIYIKALGMIAEYLPETPYSSENTTLGSYD